jgi:hypothetical protein
MRWPNDPFTQTPSGPVCASREESEVQRQLRESHRQWQKTEPANRTAPDSRVAQNREANPGTAGDHKTKAA